MVVKRLRLAARIVELAPERLGPPLTRITARSGVIALAGLHGRRRGFRVASAADALLAGMPMHPRLI